MKYLGQGLEEFLAQELLPLRSWGAPGSQHEGEFLLTFLLPRRSQNPVLCGFFYGDFIPQAPLKQRQQNWDGFDQKGIMTDSLGQGNPARPICPDSVPVLQGLGGPGLFIRGGTMTCPWEGKLAVERRADFASCGP